MAGLCLMIDEFAKEYLHDDLRSIREAMLWKLDGLSEYDVRRPLTPTGTNLLGLIKHVASIELGYFGDTFGRPYTSRTTSTLFAFARPCRPLYIRATTPSL